MKIFKTLTAALISIGYVMVTLPAKAEWPPDAVIKGVYEGIAALHGYEMTPIVIWNVVPGSIGGCGSIDSPHYCALNHTIYIPSNFISWVYQYGDAALAYTVAHEYAHAMQTAYGFKSTLTPISELQADCLAGFYLGKIHNIRFDNRDVAEIQTLAYNAGDNSYWSLDHHGDPVQRFTEVTIGMQASVYGNVNACFQ